MVGERITKVVDREPILKKAQDRVSERVSSIRNRPGSRAEKVAPQFENRNLGGGVMTGAIAAGVATILEDTVGLPFGASVDIVNVEATEGGEIYTVNVNAPTENIAEARALIDSATGFTSYLTDTFSVESVDVLNHRIARDTYQIELKVNR